MPVYEYECKKCGHCFEFLLLHQAEKPSCEVCGSHDLKRLLSTFATRVNSDSSESSSCATGTCPTGTCSVR
jgi:putative FmdB family regulatory protein